MCDDPIVLNAALSDALRSGLATVPFRQRRSLVIDELSAVNVGAVTWRALTHHHRQRHVAEAQTRVASLEGSLSLALVGERLGGCLPNVRRAVTSLRPLVVLAQHPKR